MYFYNLHIAKFPKRYMYIKHMQMVILKPLLPPILIKHVILRNHCIWRLWDIQRHSESSLTILKKSPQKKIIIIRVFIMCHQSSGNFSRTPVFSLHATRFYYSMKRRAVFQSGSGVPQALQRFLALGLGPSFLLCGSGRYEDEITHLNLLA